MTTLQELAQRRTVIAAHRGVTGGNVGPNTIESFEAALAEGADMLEMDVVRTRDDRLVVFHLGMEKPHLYRAVHIGELTEKEALQLRYVNGDDVETEQTVQSLDTVFQRFKGRCFINVDRAWDDLDLLADYAKRNGVSEQIVLKSPPEMRYFQNMEKWARDFMYMPIITETDTCSDYLEHSPLRYIGAELVFSREDSPVAAPAYIEEMHEKGRLLWGNAIVFNYKRVLSAGHNDDVSIIEDPSLGWGWLQDHGFDIIQTDWPGLVRQYLKARQAGGMS